MFKKTDFKTDSFSKLFTDVLSGVFGRLPDFYKNRSFNNTGRHMEGGMLKIETRNIMHNLCKNSYDNVFVILKKKVNFMSQNKKCEDVKRVGSI